VSFPRNVDGNPLNRTLVGRISISTRTFPLATSLPTCVEMLGIEPRDYQVEAARWALKQRHAVVCLPTGSGKTVVAAVWIEHVLREGVSKILVLAPTRILVEQIARFLTKVLGIEVVAIHGLYPKHRRVELWRRARIVVTTPETALSDVDTVVEQGFGAIVVDECHHTTGMDAYAKFMRATKDLYRYRLGLSAFVPPSRRKEIEELIGTVRVWSWSDPRIAKYVPTWIGEVYEAELLDRERELLKRLEELHASLEGRERGLARLAMRWFVRDGFLALWESWERSEKLRKLIDLSPYRSTVRELHKLDALMRVLRDHEGFSKAIVFVDRVVVAYRIAESLKALNPVVICGKARASHDVRKLLEMARDPNTKLIVSTSAGEEGLDLPEGDLLVVWSNVASPLRFIQRHGRILRATEKRGPPKFVTYIVTPDTIDMDSLIDGIELAKKVGIDVPVSEEVLESLWRRSSRARILQILEESPMPLEWVAEILGVSTDVVRNDARKLCSRGDLVYIYTHLGKVYASSEAIHRLYEEFGEYLQADGAYEVKVKPFVGGRYLRAVSGNSFHEVFEKLRKVLARHGSIEKLHVSASVPLPTGALKLVNLVFSYLIDDEKKLELALRNAFSIHRLEPSEVEEADRS